MNLSILVILLSSIVTILSIRLYRYKKLYKETKLSYESVYKTSKKLIGMCDDYLKQKNIILEPNGTIDKNNILNSENNDLNLDDILSKINKLGFESISKREIDFLKNYKNL